MKIVTWNINGIRTFKHAIKKTLDSFDADIICVQETKVTRDLLEERSAVVDGYNSYFSFCRGRSGYSGVATFCKDSATPFAAEEGLTGGLSNNGAEAVGFYGDHEDLSTEELQLLDNEGRAVITQHQIMGSDGSQTLSVVNVYCPRADPEKPERKLFKLQFYRLLQARAEALLASGSHVIVLGDINTSHRPIDHCDPDGDTFEDNPGRKWLTRFLFGAKAAEDDDEEEHDQEDEDHCDDRSNAPTVSRLHHSDSLHSSQTSTSSSGGKFVDTFRQFHPTRPQAFTCWNTLTGARQTNYGTRIDYIFADHALAELFVSADIMPEVEGSDHCPVWGQLRCEIQPSPRYPALCTRYMPEFAGKQQNLSRFLVKIADKPQHPAGTADSQGEAENQDTQRSQKNVSHFGSGVEGGRKRWLDGTAAEASVPKSKKSNAGSKAAAAVKSQGSLLNFFKHKGLTAKQTEKTTHDQSASGPTEGNGHSLQESLSGNQQGGNDLSQDITKDQELANGRDMPIGDAGESKKGTCPAFWKTVLCGPPQPPLCKVHKEPCVLRTVKKAGPTMGRQFFVCARPQGHASNPQARCNFFAWVDKGK
ncbi:DNA-(apurinic or apyrimidinic site) lyase 2 [Engraulis encrasicolus]|uniref:DNA-(apurinic or apyrimidinic site) lyase 2 n=1 Tax=Engraulis encrasicolus TaxID=184585 RepID=UPI002FCF3583